MIREVSAAKHLVGLRRPCRRKGPSVESGERRGSRIPPEDCRRKRGNPDSSGDRAQLGRGHLGGEDDGLSIATGPAALARTTRREPGLGGPQAKWETSEKVASVN